MKNTNIKSPLNYIGGKYKLLPQITPIFPRNINTFIDLFTGGCNVAINTKANKIIANDNLTYLIDLYKELQNNSIEFILEHINKQIETYNLSKTNQEGYNQFRIHYNTNKHPLDLFILIAHSFNHQIRYNNKHQFNMPFGKNKGSFNDSIKKNLINFINKLQSINIEFSNKNFDTFDFESLNLNNNDFIYCDPPYLITVGTYNDGKRGFTGWSEKQEYKLLNLLELANQNNIKFALSNVLAHKGKENMILKNWLEENKEFKIHYLDFDYSNSNYHTIVKEKNSSLEILVTNY